MRACFQRTYDQKRKECTKKAADGLEKLLDVYATETLSYLIYMQTSQFFEIGYGSALAVVTLLIVAVPVILIVRRDARAGRPRKLEA